MKIFAFAASLKTGSLNGKFVAQAAEILKNREGVQLDLARFREFEMPVYDGDLEETSGIPTGAKELIRRIQAADALLISTPEYNGGISGAFKNAIDWATRGEANPFKGKPILLMGATPGALSAIRGLWHSRQPLEALGAFVYPEMMGVGHAHQAFGDDGKFVDPKNTARLQALIESYLKFVSGVSGSR